MKLCFTLFVFGLGVVLFDCDGSVAATFVVSFVVALVSGYYCRRMKRKLGSSDMV